MKLWDKQVDCSCCPTPLPDCLCHVSFSRYSPLSLKIVEKPNKCQRFLAPIFQGGTTSTSPWQIVSGPTIHHLAKFGRCPSAKPGNEMECRIYRGRVKTHFQFEALCGRQFIWFRDDLGDPLQFATHLAAYVYSVSFGGYRTLKLPLSCEVVQKVVLDPQFVGQGIFQILNMSFKIRLTSDHVRFQLFKGSYHDYTK